MKEWGLAQTHRSQQLALLHHFSILKPHAEGQIELRITVREYVTPKEPTMHFFAQTGLELNQRTAPYRPSGWGKTLLEALAECVKNIDRFPYEGAATAGS